MRGAGKTEARQSQARAKASSKDILSDAAGAIKPGKINPQWQRYYKILLDLRRYFLNETDVLHQEANEEYTGPRHNDADVATNTYDRDWALGMLSSEQDALYDIDEALERIRNGTYGICGLTGKRIPLERLNAIPWTRFTAEAEREFERNGEMERSKAKLGEHEAIPKEHPPERYGRE